MRELLTSLILASCLLPVAAGAMKISSDLASSPKPHSFANLDDEPLWSSEVRRIDVSQQSYERIPAAVSSSAAAADIEQANRVNALIMPSDLNQDNYVEISSVEAEKPHAVNAHSCISQGGGSRRPCVAPSEVQGKYLIDTGNTPDLDSHARWCMQRYNSYRAVDNTYQPYTGTRKQCVSPDSKSASVISYSQF